jgi:hypothetical protein
MAAPIVACTCSREAPAPVCELVARSQVVLLGTVVAAEPDPALPNVSNVRICRLRIDRPFKGMQPGESTILLNPDKFISSCQTQYLIGRQYLIFGGRIDGPRSTLISGACSGSRLAMTSNSGLKKYVLPQTRTELLGKVSGRSRLFTARQATNRLRYMARQITAGRVERHHSRRRHSTIRPESELLKASPRH